MICSSCYILLGLSDRGGGDGYSMWHVWGRREMHMKLGVGNSNGIHNLEDLGTDGRITLK